MMLQQEVSSANRDLKAAGTAACQRITATISMVTGLPEFH